MNYANGFLKFLQKAVTPYHAVEGLEEELIRHNYTRLYENKEWNLELGGKYYVIKADSAIIAFRLPAKLHDLSFNIVSSHTDSPNFKVKPNETLKSAVNTLMLRLEPYGGTIFSSWLDRPLGIAGRVIVKENNKLVTKLVDFDRPMCVIPNLAIHQNRTINDGYKYQPHVDLLPLLSDSLELNIYDLVADELDIKRSDIVSVDLSIYNHSRGSFFGANSEYIVAPQIDNLESAYLTLEGFLLGGNYKSCNVYCAFDSEEVGSGTKNGALSNFLHDTIKRIAICLNISEEELLIALSKSFMVSCDNAHATHPNQPAISDSMSKVYLNKGIVIKTNANQLYTTDAVSFALIKTIFENNGINYQIFANRSDQRGGSTLGHLSVQKVTLDCVDIGLAQLAMHSSMETCGANDLETLVLGVKAFYDVHLSKDEKGNFIID